MRFRLEERLSGAPSPPAAEVSPDAAGALNGLILERPPPGLARGKYPASAWSIALLGGALLLITAGYFISRWRKKRV